MFWKYIRLYRNVKSTIKTIIQTLYKSQRLIYSLINNRIVDDVEDSELQGSLIYPIFPFESTGGEKLQDDLSVLSASQWIEEQKWNEKGNPPFTFNEDYFSFSSLVFHEVIVLYVTCKINQNLVFSKKKSQKRKFQLFSRLFILIQTCFGCCFHLEIFIIRSIHYQIMNI